MRVFAAQAQALVPGGDLGNFQLPEFPHLVFSLNCSSSDAVLIARDERTDEIVPPPPIEAILNALKYVHSPPWVENRHFSAPVCTSPPEIALSKLDRDLVPGSELFLKESGKWQRPQEMSEAEWPVESYWAYESGRPTSMTGVDDVYVLGPDDVGERLMVIERIGDETAHSNVIGPVGGSPQ